MTVSLTDKDPCVRMLGIVIEALEDLMRAELASPGSLVLRHNRIASIATHAKALAGLYTSGVGGELGDELLEMGGGLVIPHAGFGHVQRMPGRLDQDELLRNMCGVLETQVGGQADAARVRMLRDYITMRDSLVAAGTDTAWVDERIEKLKRETGEAAVVPAPAVPEPEGV